VKKSAECTVPRGQVVASVVGIDLTVWSGCGVGLAGRPSDRDHGGQSAGGERLRAGAAAPSPSVQESGVFPQPVPFPKTWMNQSFSANCAAGSENKPLTAAGGPLRHPKATARAT